MSRKLKIIFMGTPEFAVPSLDILIQNSYNVVAVVTAPDRPAGRGRKITYSAVKKYALEHQIHVLQPTNLKLPEFLDELKSYQANLQIVVAFRMLPETVWKMPSLGTFNLHASLLPKYRGAAPINWAIINGEKETGITTFFIDEKIDTGRIILQDSLKIGDAETAGELHDRLMIKGSDLVLNSVKAIESNQLHLHSQDEFISGSEILKPAPKIFKEDTKIDWGKPQQSVFNFIRGLSPYPGAYTRLYNPDNESWVLKIYNCHQINREQKPQDVQLIPGRITTDEKTYLHVACNDGVIAINELQLEGKKRMNISDFLRGFSISERWKMEK